MRYLKNMKLISIFLLSCLILNGCQIVEETIKQKDYTQYDYKQPDKEVDTDTKNIKYYADTKASIQTKDNSDIKIQEDFLRDNDVFSIKNEDGTYNLITYKELAESLSQNLKFTFGDYRMREKLIFNYTNISDLQLNGIYITETVDTVRKAEQYYRDSKRTLGQNSFNRNVSAIKYKNKANLELLKGTFFTREKDKKVNLEWNPIEYIEESPDVINFIAPKELDFVNISKFYYYNSNYDFKAQGTATLRDFMNWNTVDNTGIRTLHDNKLKITKEFIEKGVTTERSVEIDPLKATFNFDIQVSQDNDNNLVIDITISDLTKALKVYYAAYPENDIINASYTLNIIRYPVLDEGIAIGTASDIISTNSDSKYNEYGWFIEDGVYKYRDNNGNILRNTTTPDGYRVDRNGIYIED